MFATASLNCSCVAQNTSIKLMHTQVHPMPSNSKLTSKETVKEAQRNAKDKALTSRVVANGARKVIKQVVDWLECHLSHAGPCLLGLRDGLFDMGESDGTIKDTVTFAASADYIRLRPMSVIKPILVDLGGLTEESIIMANKYDEKAYIKLFCFMFCEVQGQPTPSKVRHVFPEIYTKWSEIVGKRTPVFIAGGAVDWSKGAFCIKSSEVADPHTEGQTTKVIEVHHVSGTKATTTIQYYSQVGLKPCYTIGLARCAKQL